MANKPRILVTYGCHLEEKYAEAVGEKFRDTYLQSMFPDVVVGRWRGIRGYNRLAQIRQDLGAKYAIDLHDDSTYPQRARREWGKSHSPLPFEDWYERQLENERQIGEKYYLVSHMPYDEGMALLQPFTNKWNIQHGEESRAVGCECEYINPARKGRPCELSIIGLEYFILPYKVSTKQGVRFLKELVEHLQTE